jgi:spore coat polysaccharide biosynthesis protein SpsF (cytidylyltransferase family)
MYPNGMILFELDSSKSVRFREDQFLVYGSLILVNYLLNRVLKISKVQSVTLLTMYLPSRDTLNASASKTAAFGSPRLIRV